VIASVHDDDIASTLPKGAAGWPMQRDRGQCFIQVEGALIYRMRAMRRPGESYSAVILRLAAGGPTALTTRPPVDDVCASWASRQ
jgi:hypothetical protein